MDRLIVYPIVLVLFVVTFFSVGKSFSLILLPAVGLSALAYIIWLMGPAFIPNIFSMLFTFLIFVFMLRIERKLIYVLALMAILVAPVTFYVGFTALASYFVGAFFFLVLVGAAKDVYEKD